MMDGGKVLAAVGGKDPPASSVSRIALSFVGDRGVNAFVAYWEDVIGINANSPMNVPDAFATQQSIDGLFVMRHQLLSLFLPITSTFSPDRRIVTTR